MGLAAKLRGGSAGQVPPAPVGSSTQQAHAQQAPAHSSAYHGSTTYSQGSTYPQQGQQYPHQGQSYPQQGQSYPQQGQSQHGQQYPQQAQRYPQQGQQYSAYNAPNQVPPGSYNAQVSYGQSSYAQQEYAQAQGLNANTGAYPPGEYPVGGQQTYSASKGQGATSMLGSLEACVARNNLHSLYPPQRLHQVVEHLERTKSQLDALGARWHLSEQVKLDLCQLALYDVVLLCDDSGSMQFAENGERINDLKAAIGYIAEVATLFDADGLSVRFLNSTLAGDGIRTCSEADRLVSQVKFAGLTPLGTSLDTKILRPCLYDAMRSNSIAKPILVIVITDGSPAGEPEGHVFNVISQAKEAVHNRGNLVSFSFAQVGTDQAAQKFLHDIDCHPVCGSIVDVTSSFELEEQQVAQKGLTLSPEMWIAKLLLGSIDSSYDSLDEFLKR